MGAMLALALRGAPTCGADSAHKGCERPPSWAHRPQRRRPTSGRANHRDACPQGRHLR
ncbi:unnamed protein product [Musa textilis]